MALSAPATSTVTSSLWPFTFTRGGSPSGGVASPRRRIIATTRCICPPSVASTGSPLTSGSAVPRPGVRPAPAARQPANGRRSHRGTAQPSISRLSALYFAPFESLTILLKNSVYRWFVDVGEETRLGLG